MAVFFDETYEEEQGRERLEHFYGSYSADIRKKLLTKNVKRPDNLYDVLYTPVRRDLLSKNIPSQINIDETSTEIRNKLLARQINKDINLDESGENIRKSLLAKNDLVKSSIELENIAEASRKSLASKNAPNKNANPETGSDKIRHNLVSKNTPTNIDLDAKASDIRQSLLSKNDGNQQNLESVSAEQRQNLLSKNITNTNDIDSSSGHIRKDLLSKNIASDIDLDKTSSIVRENLLSKNKDTVKDLDVAANAIRPTLLSANKPKPSTLDADSETIRQKLDSKNKSDNTSIDAAAGNIREKLLSKNKPGDINLDTASENVRQDLLSRNKSVKSNIDKAGETVRDNLISKNKDSGIDLDKNSQTVRSKLLSANKPSDTAIETTAGAIRDSLIGANKPRAIDLDKQGKTFRDDLISNNVSNGANPEAGASDVRDKLLSNNVSNGANPETGSEDVRKDLLSKNVPTGANPEIGANDVRNDLLSKNVPTGANPEIGASDVRDDLLSHNVPNGANPETGADDVRNDLLSKNAPNGANPETGAADIRNDLLANNVPNGANPEDGADDIRNDLLSHNVPNGANPETGAADIRNDLLSHNIPTGASPEIGAGDVRNNLISKNVPKDINLDDISSPFRHQLISKNGGNATLGANIILPNGTSQFIGISNLDILGEITRQSNKLKDKIFNGEAQSKLQKFYGTSVQPDGFTPIASITNAAQLHNIENNTFALHRYSTDSSAGLEALTQHNSNGFQDLIQKTIGSFQKYVQVGTNTTTAAIISNNKGQYLRLGDKGIDAVVKPGGDGTIGTAQSMMVQTAPSDVIEAAFYTPDFNRGVRKIINTIKKDSSIALAKNYDSQNSKSFIIGSNTNNAGLKKAFQRYTISNPYKAPLETGVMELRLTNYAIRGNGVRTMSFPPYVKAFQHSDDASWNETLFLGRPEPIYTYSNSKRSGTIEFMILTDYAQSVDFGVDFEKEATLTETFDKHFTDATDANKQINDLEAQVATGKKNLAALNKKKAQVSSDDNNVSGKAAIDAEIAVQQASINSLQAKLDELHKSPNAGPSRLFTEGTKEGGNIYQNIMDGLPENDVDGTKINHPSNTRVKLDEMKQKLLFQPAFFSGDKVDFLRRMEFISKLTRPSRSAASDGFSFTNPPVCHLHLGSWINNDIIINSVSYSYDDAPWTYDSGRVQPMWATVTLSFNIIGTYGGLPTENVPLATDTGGFFQRRVSS